MKRRSNSHHHFPQTCCCCDKRDCRHAARSSEPKEIALEFQFATVQDAPRFSEQKWCKPCVDLNRKRVKEQKQREEIQFLKQQVQAMEIVKNLKNTNVESTHLKKKTLISVMNLALHIRNYTR